MSDDPPKGPPNDVDDDKRAILARRSLFVAATLAGLARAQIGCAACLSPLSDPAEPSDASAETAPQPCLSIAIDSGPMPRDAGDAAPQPCLAPLPPDAGDASSDDASTDGGTD